MVNKVEGFFRDIKANAAAKRAQETATVAASSQPTNRPQQQSLERKPQPAANAGQPQVQSKKNTNDQQGNMNTTKPNTQANTSATSATTPASTTTQPAAAAQTAAPSQAAAPVQQVLRRQRPALNQLEQAHSSVHLGSKANVLAVNKVSVQADSQSRSTSKRTTRPRPTSKRSRRTASKWSRYTRRTRSASERSIRWSRRPASKRTRWNGSRRPTIWSEQSARARPAAQSQRSRRR